MSAGVADMFVGYSTTLFEVVTECVDTVWLRLPLTGEFTLLMASITMYSSSAQVGDLRFQIWLNIFSFSYGQLHLGDKRSCSCCHRVWLWGAI